MQANGRLVEDIDRADERAAQGCCQVDALALAARQSRRQAIEREVAYADLTQVVQAAIDLGEQAFGYQCIGLVKCQLGKPLCQVLDRHAHQVTDGHSAHLDVLGMGLEPRAVADGAYGLAAVAGQQHAKLDGIGFTLYPLKEAVDAAPLAIARAVPQQVALSLCQLVVGLVDREVVPCRNMDELSFPFAHHLSTPAHHGVVIHRATPVGNHQVLVNADHAAEAFARGACPDGVVEVEHQVARLVKGHPVQFKALRKAVLDHGSVLLPHHDDALVLALVEGRLQ